MLFWKAKKHKRLADEGRKLFAYDIALVSLFTFKQAYKILKGTK
jgi:hypothetical protein